MRLAPERELEKAPKHFCGTCSVCVCERERSRSSEGPDEILNERHLKAHLQQSPEGVFLQRGQGDWSGHGHACSPWIRSINLNWLLV